MSFARLALAASLFSGFLGCSQVLDYGAIEFGPGNSNDAAATDGSGGTGNPDGADVDGTSGDVATGGGGSSGSGPGTVEGHACSRTSPDGQGDDPNGVIPICCTPLADEKDFIDTVFELLNEYRQTHGVAPLSYDSTLESSVQAHCLHMALHPFFADSAPEQSVRSPWSRASLCGVSASGQNLATCGSVADEAMNLWSESRAHNANMLNPQFTRVGIGKYGPYCGQLFGP